MTFELLFWKLQNENKCHCLNNTWYNILNIFGISFFFPWNHYVYHLIFKILKRTYLSKSWRNCITWKPNQRDKVTCQIKHGLSCFCFSVTGPTSISSQCHKNHVPCITHVADKSLNIYKDYRNASAEVFAMWATAAQFWSHPWCLLHQGSHGSGLPELLSRCILGTGAPISSYCALILIPCLHPIPSHSFKLAYVQLLIHILPLLRGWWSCSTRLWRQILKPGTAFHTWPKTTFAILTVCVIYLDIL